MATMEANPAEDGGIRPAKILVVDDEPDLEILVRQKFRRRIRRGEFEFTFAQNGLEALERLAENPELEMILSDINMPRLDGLSLLNALGDVNPEIRAVMVSAYGDMDNIRTAMNRGAFDFVTKPIDFEDLETTIDKTLRHSRVMREALSSQNQLHALRQELNIAHSMQLSILPTSFPSTPEYEVHGRVIPAKEVGGDFYDVYRLEDGQLGIVIADVSGKGIPAALFMMVCRTLLKGIAIGMASPAEALTEANALLHAENQASMFVTVFYGVFNPRSGALTFANAGHEPPVVRRLDGSTEALPFTGGVPLGIVDDMQFEERTSNIESGEFVYLFTDGVTEALNEAEEEFGNDRVHETISGVDPGPAREAVEALVRTVVRFSGEAEQFDDLTCLVLKAGGNSQ
ncbi:MAG: SpoIIE family protein phosphatase [Immundisolibacterales bacterium]|nr:SpoIIE family protein phosphatase [Immundisolibacterales bacterium]